MFDDGEIPLPLSPQPIEERSSENPAYPVDYEDGFIFDGNTTSGVRVNHNTAFTYAAVWRAIDMISRDVAKLPLITYERVGNGKQPARQHPAYMLLKRRPNDEQSAFTFKQAMQRDVLARGNAYSFIRRGANDRPDRLWRLDPLSTYPVRENGVLWYITTRNTYVTDYGGNQTGELAWIPARNILHLRGMGNGLEGMDVIAYARDSLGLGMAAQRYGSRFFNNDAQPGMTLEVPGRLSEKARNNLRNSWSKMHKGLDSAHNPAILEEGIKVSTLGMDNENAQFLETRQFEIREVANWFGLPPHKLGDPSRTAFASLEQENQSYLDQSLDPWLVNWESECWEKLLAGPEQSSESITISFTRQALVRADMGTRGEYYTKALTNGWLNKDEVRNLEDRNPIPDGDGEVFTEPLNLTPVGSRSETEDTRAVGEPSSELPPSTVPVHSLRRLVSDTAERMTKRIGVQAKRAAKRPDSFIAWIDEKMQDHRDVIRSAFEPIVSVAMGDSDDLSEVVDHILSEMRGRLLEASECPQSELVERVAIACDDAETQLPPDTADMIVGV